MTKIKAIHLLLILGLCTQTFVTAAEKIDMIEGGSFEQFNEHMIHGWSFVGSVSDVDGERKLAYGDLEQGGAEILVNGEYGNGGAYLLTKENFGDVRVQVEFMIPKDSNSGVYLMGRYEIQIFDSYGVKEPGFSDLGGIYQRWDDNRVPAGYEGYGPKVNAAKAPGKWQTLDITFRAPRFDRDGKKTENAKFVKVLVNGRLVQEDHEVTGSTRAAMFGDEQAEGPVMIQGDHGPIAIRSYWVTPLDLR